MTPTQAKAEVKARLEEYLQAKGIDASRAFRCLNPAHRDEHPSMRLDRQRNKCHCFGCGQDYDTFDLIALDYGLTEGREIFRKAYEYFRLSPVYPPGEGGDLVDYGAYFEACRGRIRETDYWRRRGLAWEVVEGFGLGFDPQYCQGTGGQGWEALIIPTGGQSFVARNTALSASAKDRYRKVGASRVFNTQALRESASPIWVVEGELDALAVLSVGGQAVALGSTANLRSFLRITQATPPCQPLILALDNDPQGQSTADALEQGLVGQGIAPYRINPYGAAKDAGEAITQDRDAFERAIAGAATLEHQARQAERDAYLRTSAAVHLGQFLDGLHQRVNTPSIPTGFQALDTALDNGLYEGLYILGAISSLGKTTLLTQIGDQIAQSGTDVLIFSLEMARAQLMAKSISRQTLLQAQGQGLPLALAKTARGITDASRHPAYSPTEKSLIQSAINAYSAYAHRIFIHEGTGDLSTAHIRQALEEHIAFTGRRPVLLLDYLQILAPHSPRATDKQNMDKSVLELKRISRDYKIPLLAISSFNRASYNDPASMEAFKESGALEYSSDVLLALQLQGTGKKPFDPTAEKTKNPRKTELIILKNREGKVGQKVRLDYYPQYNFFQETQGHE